MLTVSDSERDMIEAIGRGAAGYLTKDLTPEALLRALRGTQRGELAMSRRFAARAVRHFVSAARRGRMAGSGGGVIDGLSPRENDVLRMLAEGLTDKEIAGALVISPRTVETHVSNVLHKLDVRNRAEAAQRYRESGCRGGARRGGRAAGGAAGRGARSLVRRGRRRGAWSRAWLLVAGKGGGSQARRVGRGAGGERPGGRGPAVDAAQGIDPTAEGSAVAGCRGAALVRRTTEPPTIGGVPAATEPRDRVRDGPGIDGLWGRSDISSGIRRVERRDRRRGGRLARPLSVVLAI